MRPAREKRMILYAVSFLFDCASLPIGYVTALLLRDATWLKAAGQPVIAIALPIFLMFEIAREVQSVEALESRSVGVQRALGSLLATALIVLGLSFLFKADDISRLAFITTFGIAAIVLVLGKIVLDIMVKRWMGGAAISAILLQDGLVAERRPGCDFVDVEKLGLQPSLDDPSSIDALSRLVAPYDRVVVSCSYELRAGWATFLKSQGVLGEILLDRDLLLGAVEVGAYGQNDTLVLTHGPLSLSSRIQKRCFDLVVSSLALLILAPVMLVVAVAIKLESPGPVLFRQIRLGEGSRHFMILKFRSMRVEAADDHGHVSTQRDDPRLTRVGKFIRRTSIDELPQLWNVLRGDIESGRPAAACASFPRRR